MGESSIPGVDTNRRRHLRGIAGIAAAALTGLSGCTGGDPTDTGDGTPTDAPPGEQGTVGTGDTRPEGTGGPGVSVVAVDEAPDLPVEPSVTVVREAATPEHPPRLRTTLTDTSGESVRVGEGRAVHFEYVTDDSGALQLLPPGGDYPAEADCWRLAEGIAVSEEYRTFEIEAGGASERPVDLYATPGEDACLPVGEYRFETTLSVVDADGEAQSSARWGFSVVLE